MAVFTLQGVYGGGYAVTLEGVGVLGFHGQTALGRWLDWLFRVPLGQTDQLVVPGLGVTYQPCYDEGTRAAWGVFVETLKAGAAQLPETAERPIVWVDLCQ